MNVIFTWKFEVLGEFHEVIDIIFCHNVLPKKSKYKMCSSYSNFLDNIKPSVSAYTHCVVSNNITRRVNDKYSSQVREQAQH